MIESNQEIGTKVKERQLIAVRDMISNELRPKYLLQVRAVIYNIDNYQFVVLTSPASKSLLGEGKERMTHVVPLNCVLNGGIHQELSKRHPRVVTRTICFQPIDQSLHS